MTFQAGEVGQLKMRACLLLVMWQWTQQALATPCQDGELRIIGKGEKKCCPKCNSKTGDNSPCPDIMDHDCRCPQRYSCSDRACGHCQKLPECGEGKELVRFGVLDFSFRCKPCEQGTYSNVKNGWCQNWTDCEDSGLLTIKQGNRTHNTVCGFLVKVVQQDESLYTTVLAILTAVALFVLILLTFFLHFCLWSLKKGKYYPADDLEHNFSRLLVSPQPPHHREEIDSCQFPEEEHGDKTPEEKPCSCHQQSLQ